MSSLALEYGRLDSSGVIVFDDEADKEIYESINMDNCTIFYREHS